MFLFLLLSVAKPTVMRSQPVVLTGFVLGQRPGGFVLARIVITCCAADASTAKVEVTASTPAPAVGGWVQVIGTYTGSEPDTNQTPKLTATSITAIDQPANPYDH
jgi:putative membrane protein